MMILEITADFVSLVARESRRPTIVSSLHYILLFFRSPLRPAGRDRKHALSKAALDQENAVYRDKWRPGSAAEVRWTMQTGYQSSLGV